MSALKNHIHAYWMVYVCIAIFLVVATAISAFTWHQIVLSTVEPQVVYVRDTIFIENSRLTVDSTMLQFYKEQNNTQSEAIRKELRNIRIAIQKDEVDTIVVKMVK